MSLSVQEHLSGSARSEEHSSLLMDFSNHNIDNHQDAGELNRDARRALAAIEYITDHLKADDEDKKTRDDWKYVAMVIDRLLLYIFFGVTMGGTLGILLSAPNVFDYVDQAEVIARITS